MAKYELALRCVLVFMLLFDANGESVLDLVFTTLSERINNLDRSFEFKLNHTVKTINERFDRIEKVIGLYQKDNKCDQIQGFREKHSQEPNARNGSNHCFIEAITTWLQRLTTFVNREKMTELQLIVKDILSEMIVTMLKTNDTLIREMLRQTKDNFEDINQIETDEDFNNIYPGIDTVNDKTNREKYIVSDGNIGDFLVFSKVAELVSIRLKDFNDINEGISVSRSIKSPDFMHFVIGLSFDYERKLIFYSDVERGDVIAVDFTGTSFHTVVEGFEPVEGLAYERFTDALYWTSSAYSCISKINVNDAIRKKSNKPELVVQLTQGDYPRAIAVDSCFGLIYWTNWNIEQPSIQRSSLNGHNVENVIVNDIQSPYGLVIDHKDKMLYWSDTALERIERCDMDGTNRQVVIESMIQPSFGLVIHDEYMFWTDYTSRSVVRANKYNGTEMVMLHEGLEYQPMDIIVVTEESDDCDKYKCHSDKYSTDENACLQRKYGFLKDSGKSCAYGNKRSWRKI